MAQSLRMASTTITLNDFGEFTKRQSTRKDGTPGAVRYTSTIYASPVVTRFDAKMLGKGPAQAIAKHLRERVGGISSLASAGTQKIRAHDAKTLSGVRGNGQEGPVRQSEYLRKRYDKALPNQTQRMFSDSGRMAKGITVGAAKGNAWIVNVPANRLNPTLLSGGEQALRTIYAKLLQYVPEFGNGSKLRDILSVRRAIKDATPLIDPRLAKQVGKKIAGFFTQDVSLRQVVDGIRDVYGLAA